MRISFLKIITVLFGRFLDFNMKKFLRIAEHIPAIFEHITTKYGFKLFIFKDRLELLSLNCTILIEVVKDAPDSETFIINPQSESKNIYEFWKIRQLRKIPFVKYKLHHWKDSYDACRIEDLKINAELLRLFCPDVLEGNFKKLDEEGYWELPPLTILTIEEAFPKVTSLPIEEIAFQLENERIPD